MKPTRTHKARRENRSVDQLSKYGAVSLREQARFLDINHDLVIGVFDKLEERVIGARGITVEPQPLRKNGEMAAELAADIRRLWAEWSVSPDVTGQYTDRAWGVCCGPGCGMVKCLRRWSVVRETSLERTAGVPFWLEAMEPDFVPCAVMNPPG
ncbi:phage portal protein [Escherichia coli]